MNSLSVLWTVTIEYFLTVKDTYVETLEKPPDSQATDCVWAVTWASSNDSILHSPILPTQSRVSILGNYHFVHMYVCVYMYVRMCVHACACYFRYLTSG